MHASKLVGICALLLLSVPRTNLACRAKIMNQPEVVCTNADVVVTAVAIDYADDPPTNTETADIAFEVKEVIKGHPLGRFLYINGTLTEQNDFNTAQVPYDVVRSSGLLGSCHAFDYKRGGLFLFCLTYTKKGELTPYWGSMSPTNEQLRSEKDPWLIWVKNYLATHPCAARWGMTITFDMAGGLTEDQVKYYLGNAFKYCSNRTSEAVAEIISNQEVRKYHTETELKATMEETDSLMIFRRSEGHPPVFCSIKAGDTIVGLRRHKTLWYIACFGSSPLGSCSYADGSEEKEKKAKPAL